LKALAIPGIGDDEAFAAGGLETGEAVAEASPAKGPPSTPFPLSHPVAAMIVAGRREGFPPFLVRCALMFALMRERRPTNSDFEDYG
jgi:hypothetical protein